MCLPCVCVHDVFAVCVCCSVCALVCLILYVCVLYVYAGISLSCSLALSRSFARARSLSSCKDAKTHVAHTYTRMRIPTTHPVPYPPKSQPPTPKSGRHAVAHAMLFHFTTHTHHSHLTAHDYRCHFPTRRETYWRKCPTHCSSDPKTWRPPGCAHSSRRFRSQSKCRCTKKGCRMRFKKGKT